MDDGLLAAFRYDKPSRAVVALSRAALRLHGFIGVSSFIGRPFGRPSM